MQLTHIKLKNGDDLLCNYEPDDHGGLVSNVMQLCIDPSMGFFAKSWLLLSESNTVYINSGDILFYGSASEKAISYYEEFISKIVDSSASLEEDDTSDMEDMFVSMLESKSATKH